MNLEFFWLIVEKAWESAPEYKNRRKENLIKLDQYWNCPNDLGIEFEKIINEIVYPSLEAILIEFSKEESYEFNRILEKLLYDLDREEVHNSIEGSDDTFLYARGFVIAMGKEYYNRVNLNPSKGVHLNSCGFAYLTRALHNELHEEDGVSDFEVSRESCSNLAEWGLK